MGVLQQRARQDCQTADSDDADGSASAWPARTAALWAPAGPHRVLFALLLHLTKLLPQD